LSGLSILLVDDNATNRLVGGKILEVLGATASLCESGLEAVERAGAETFDLILMDVNMPVMDGIEATRRIRALPGLSGQVPIVALTANVMAHQRQNYLEAGMNGVVPKPLSPAALLAEIIRVASGEPGQDADQAA
jgi:CheY-like chemotaxis protein